jgi:chemotaxis response regulator CheB
MLRKSSTRTKLSKSENETDKTKPKITKPQLKPSVSPVTEEPEPDHEKMELLPYKGFPVVGIGASAGGLEALEVFLQNVPEAGPSGPGRWAAQRGRKLIRWPFFLKRRWQRKNLR